MTRFAAAVLVGSVLVLAQSCTRDVLVGEARSGTRSPDGGAASGGASPDAAPSDARPDVPEVAAPDARACVPVDCEGARYQCGNCLDDDADGLVDDEDPDCLGPCHDSESSFQLVIPGQPRSGCDEDCYFDQDTGSGNDGCLWSHRCDPFSAEPGDGPAQDCSYDPTTKLPHQQDCAAASSGQTTECRAACLPLTPNGCDCFGCCVVPGAPTAIWLGSHDQQGNPTCNLAHAGDPTLCHPCLQVPSCVNPCDACELCVGKWTLPPACLPDSGCAKPVCPVGRQPCGSDCLPQCPAGQACVTGCCVDPPR